MKSWLMKISLLLLFLTTPVAAEPELVLFGDSMTRAVLADHALGAPMHAPQTWHLLRTFWNKVRSGYLPEDEGILNYMLMTRNEFLARDQLAAVQGVQSYSIRTRLMAERGISLRMSNFAQLGGSYRVGELQLALYARSLQGRSPAPLIIVDLGRSDFTITLALEDFQKDVDAFYERLLDLSPGSRILVLRIPDIPSILHRSDRTAAELFDLLPLRCGTFFEQGHIASKTGLLPGRHEPATYEQQKARLLAFNAYLETKVSQLKAQGISIEIVSGVKARADAEGWDEILANDCLHLNQNGHREEAELLWPWVLALWDGPPSAPSDRTSEPPPAVLPPATLEAWNSYVDSVATFDLQDSCKPRLLLHQGPYKGVALFYHGFTACPQQFADLAERLSEKGYTVLLPLLPGHGRKPNGSQGQWLDHTEQLPTGRVQDAVSYLEYFRFVEMMNRLVTSFPGEHVVGGLSLGAALASYATVQAPYLWSHQVLLSPLYELDPSNLRNGLGTLTNINNLSHRLGALLKPVLHRSQGWGKGCEDERDPNYLAKLGRTQTRAGICQFQLTHILASNQFGFDVWNLVQPTQVKTQVVMVQEDPLLHKQMVFHSVGRMRGERLLAKPYTSEVRLDDDPFVRVCYIPSSQATCSSNQSKPLSDQDKPCVNHSLLSRFDAPFQNKYWIPTIEEKIVRFLNDGQFFATENLRSENDPLCAGFR